MLIVLNCPLNDAVIILSACVLVNYILARTQGSVRTEGRKCSKKASIMQTSLGNADDKHEVITVLLENGLYDYDYCSDVTADDG